MWHLIGMILLCYAIAVALCFPIPAIAFKDDIHQELQHARESGNRLMEKQIVLDVFILLFLAPLALLTLPTGLEQRRLRQELITNLEKKIASSKVP